MIRKGLRSWVLRILLLSMLILSGCDTGQMREYYSDEDNYITATGMVVHIAYMEEEDALYLGFSDLEPKFDDIDFKIVGDNLEIVQENGIDEILEMGSKVEFITAPRYWGDGYVMPIVAITIDGEELLEFDEGYTNFLEWFEETH